MAFFGPFREIRAKVVRRTARGRTRRILRVDGLLAVEVPGYTFRRIKTMGIVPRLLHGKSVATNLSEFLYFFSDQTMMQLLKRSGFDLKKIVLVPPVFYGGVLRQTLYKLYYLLAHLIYTLSRGSINLASKVLYLAEKSRSNQ